MVSSPVILKWRTIPIVNILNFVAFLTDLTITVKYATTGVTFAAVVCLFACRYWWLQSSVMTRIYFPVDIDDYCQLTSSAGTRVWLHADIYDRCLLPSSAMTRLCFSGDIDDRCQLPLSAGTRLWLHADIYDRCQLPSSLRQHLVFRFPNFPGRGVDLP